MLKSLRFALTLLLVLLLASPSSRAKDIEVKGKFTIITAPAADKATAEGLAALGDKALEMYAKDLEVPMPKAPFKVFLFGTIADYEKAEEPRTHGTFKSNLAFCHSTTSDILMCLQPRSGRPGGDDGMLESLFAHELVHAIEYKYFKSMDYQPDWLSEGLAEAWSERAIAREDAYCTETSPWYATFILDVRQALEDGRYIPVEKLLFEKLTGHDFVARQIRYSESFALVRLLDSPAPENAERRKKFRTFLKEVNQMTPSDDLPKKVNARFKEVFGNLIPLERELVKQAMNEKVFPWQIVLRDLRGLADGAVMAEAFPESTAISVSTGPAVGPLAMIKADVEVSEVGTKQVDLVFGYRSRTDYFVLAIAPGNVYLMRNDGEWKTLATAKIDASLYGPGKHTVRIDLDGSRVYGKLDGKTVLSFTLPEGSFPRGRWGVGTYDGRVIFRNAEGKNF